jgi:diguanylate cyclase (GGDEF)-like protein/PAS domain S-box-containing protein
VLQRVEGQAADVVGLAEDLDLARQQAEAASQEARNAAARIEAVVDTVPDGIVTIDAEGVIESANPGALQIFGYSADELSGAPISGLVRGLDLASATPQELRTGVELTAAHRDGREFPVDVSVGDMRLGHAIYYTCVIRDISERQQAEETIRKLALTDGLTGLANRNLFRRRLDDALSLARRLGRKVALVLLDLDKFKNVNDTYGHPVGDALIIEVARILKCSIREVDTVARLGGDEFAIILVNLEDRGAVDQLVSRIVAILGQSMTIDGCLIEIGVSIGVSFFPDDGGDCDDLVSKADLALYLAKANGRGKYIVYDDEMDAEIRAKRNLENELRVSLARQDLVLHFQPQIRNTDNEIVGVEALVRLRHPTRGPIPPAEFIPIAEETGLVIELGNLVLREACRTNKAWQNAGMAPFRIAVNVSPLQFRGDAFVPSVEAALADSGLDSRWLELEITESMMAWDIEHVIETLRRLREIGVYLSVDDFGTGYSSLAYLKRLPLQRLKVDRCFITNATTDHNDAAISQAVIRLGHTLDLCVVAEGVETKEQMDFLRRAGCDEVQGFYVSPPLTGTDFTAWHDKWIAPVALAM